MQLQDLVNAIVFLEKIYVGKRDEERLLKTLDALKTEVNRRQRAQVA